MIDDRVFAVSEITQRGHSECILGMLDQLFHQANCQLTDMDALVFGRGPGSFTGVRVGVAVAQGIAFAQDLPVLPVSTLAAVAQAAYAKHGVSEISVALDARMGEVYHADFVVKDGLATAVSDEQVCAPEKVRPFDPQIGFGAGSGWAVYAPTLSENFGAQLSAVDAAIYPSAEAMLPLAKQMFADHQALPAYQALPVYLRNNVAKKKGQQ